LICKKKNNTERKEKLGKNIIKEAKLKLLLNKLRPLTTWLLYCSIKRVLRVF